MKRAPKHITAREQQAAAVRYDGIDSKYVKDHAGEMERKRREWDRLPKAQGGKR